MGKPRGLKRKSVISTALRPLLLIYVLQQSDYLPQTASCQLATCTYPEVSCPNWRPLLWRGESDRQPFTLSKLPAYLQTIFMLAGLRPRRLRLILGVVIVTILSLFVRRLHVSFQPSCVRDPELVSPCILGARFTRAPQPSKEAALFHTERLALEREHHKSRIQQEKYRYP